MCHSPPDKLTTINARRRPQPTIHELAWSAVSVSVFCVSNSRTVEIFQSHVTYLSYEEQSQNSSGSVDQVRPIASGPTALRQMKRSGDGAVTAFELVRLLQDTTGISNS